MFSDKDLSIVVQGPIVDTTKDCLCSIREQYPGAHIILSTWEGSKCDELDYDELIFSKDPGDLGAMFTTSNVRNNINRQIVSTMAGLSKVKTKFALKTRTDFKSINTDWISFLGKHCEYTIDSRARFVTSRILAIGAERQFPFFVMDFVFIGLTKDLIRLFDIQKMSWKEAQYFPLHPPVNLDVYNWFHPNFRYIPEQFILVSAMEQNGIKIREIFNDCTQQNVQLLKYSNLTLASNFVLLDWDRIGFIPMKRSLQWLLRKDTSKFIYYEDWLNNFNYWIG